MTESEAAEAFSELAAILRERKLEWIVAGVQKQIAEEKTVEKTVSVPKELLPEQWDTVGEVAKRRGTATRFLSSIPFTALEQLDLLIDAVELVVVASNDMAREVVESIGADTIRFIDEARRETQSSELTRDLVRSQHRAAEALRDALQQFRELAHGE